MKYTIKYLLRKILKQNQVCQNCGGSGDGISTPKRIINHKCESIDYNNQGGI